MEGCELCTAHRHLRPHTYLMQMSPHQNLQPNNFHHGVCPLRLPQPPPNVPLLCRYGVLKVGGSPALGGGCDLRPGYRMRLMVRDTQVCMRALTLVHLSLWKHEGARARLWHRRAAINVFLLSPPLPAWPPRPPAQACACSCARVRMHVRVCVCVPPRRKPRRTDIS